MADFPPLSALPNLTLHESLNRDEIDALDIADSWLSRLSSLLVQGSLDDLSVLFHEESWWRDFVSLSWDISSKNGAHSIAEYLSSSSAGFGQLEVVKQGGLRPQLVDMGPMTYIQAGFTFRTKFGSGRGLLRLVNIGPREWKAWAIFTRLESLATQDEPTTHKESLQTLTSNLSVDDPELETEPLQVMIIGAGQGGLALAAHLQQLGLRYLIVDKVSRVGESWRARYDVLKTHTAVHSDHLPFLDCPSDSPVWRDRELVANWIEHYAQTLNLDILLNVSVGKVEYHEALRQYSVVIESKNVKKIVKAKHVVLATGSFSQVPNRPQFPGEDSFKGELYHSSRHKSASQIPDLSSKKVAIIGCGASAHDIAQDFVEKGAGGVCLVQRRPIFTFSLDSAEKYYFDLWKTPGLSVEDADLISNSMPTGLVRTLGLGISQMMAANDEVKLQGLEKAGLAFGKGDNGTSFLDYLLIKLGGIYIDQGAWDMIIDGRIKIHRCEEGVKEFNPRGFVLANGTKIEADVVVLATGFRPNKLTVEQIMGKDVAETLGDFGSIDDEQERMGWWRPTALPGFWYTTGSLAEARQFSSLLALQINAIEQGLNDQYYKR